MKALMQNKKGFALVTALLIMFALSVIGIVAVNSSIVENWMTTNTKVSKQAFFLAEAGAQEAKEDLYQKIMIQGITLDNLVKGYDGLLGTDDDYVLTRPLGAGSYQVYLTDYNSSDHSITLKSTGKGPMNSKAIVMLRVAAVNTDRIIRDPAFNFGIVTNKNLTINGVSEIDALSDIKSGTHSNGNTVINGSGTINGVVSAHGTNPDPSDPNFKDPITLTGNWDNVDKRPGATLIEVPSISEERFNQLRTAAQASGVYFNGALTYNNSGSLGGKIIFVDGDITLNGNVTNTTIVATGSVTINGSSTIDGSTINTAIFAGRDIIMNGNTSSYGAFWSNGSFVQNGRSHVIGSIVSRGDITRNGHFKFTYNGNNQNGNLPEVRETEISFKVGRWSQG